MNHIQNNDLRRALRELKTTVDGYKEMLELANQEIRTTESFCAENNILAKNDYYSYPAECVTEIDEIDGCEHHYTLAIDWRMHSNNHRLCAIVDHHTSWTEYSLEIDADLKHSTPKQRLHEFPLIESRREIRVQFAKYLAGFIKGYKEYIERLHTEIGAITLHDAAYRPAVSKDKLTLIKKTANRAELKYEKPKEPIFDEVYSEEDCPF